ncbi:AraC family transcriptional regulator [Vibrio sonorensis]|uniref:AraC family transcriptional regulator n=1 Tax=Vibrio sonorensis TaxID=1004316 RepID=UPI0008D8F116|nr:AraC family transcriptional regulator [Vibrio sonorensis]
MRSFSAWLNKYVTENQLEQYVGAFETEIKGVWFYQSLTGHNWTPFVYQSGIIVLGQGYKNIVIGGSEVSYGPNDYLVVGVPIPLMCKAVASNGEPIRGISIDIPAERLHKLIQKLDLSVERLTRGECLQGINSVSMSEEMLDAYRRLAKALCNESDAEILGEHILDEIVYRALMSSQGHVLLELANQDGHFSRIAKSLSLVHQNYSETISVEQLAKEASMSISSFHQAFREVTLETPIQYIKKVRLNKARELIHSQGVKVNDAARQVGYNSPSQFSREYKRLFNQTPKEAHNQLQM